MVRTKRSAWGLSGNLHHSRFPVSQDVDEFVGVLPVPIDDEMGVSLENPSSYAHDHDLRGATGGVMIRFGKGTVVLPLAYFDRVEN